MDRALRHPAGDPALPRARRRPLRPAPRHPARHDGHRGRASTRTSDRGASRPTPASTLTAQYFVMAVGCLSAAKRPDFAGLEDFEGDWYHTGRWPHEGVDFARQARRASSAPARPASRRSRGSPSRPSTSYVFQRTPNYSDAGGQRAARPGGAARRRSRGYDERRRRAARAVRCGRADRAARARGARRDARGAPRGVRDGLAARRHQRAVQRVHRPVHRAPRRTAPRRSSSAPRSARSSTTRRRRGCCARRTTIGTKRTCVDTGYFETYNRDNVELVDVRRSPIEAITAARRSRPADAEYEVDVIVFATGFDAMTGALLEIDIRGARRPARCATRGRTGRAPTSGWRSAGFPNLFIDHRARQPVACSATWSSRSSSTWTGSPTASRTCASAGSTRIEATARTRRTRGSSTSTRSADATLYPAGELLVRRREHPGQAARVHAVRRRGAARYRRECDEVAARGYEGFVLGTREAQATTGRRA